MIRQKLSKSFHHFAADWMVPAAISTFLRSTNEKMLNDETSTLLLQLISFPSHLATRCMRENKNEITRQFRIWNTHVGRRDVREEEEAN